MKVGRRGFGPNQSAVSAFDIGENPIPKREK